MRRSSISGTDFEALTTDHSYWNNLSEANKAKSLAATKIPEPNTHLITCTTSDATGNTTSASFTITVNYTAEALAAAEAAEAAAAEAAAAEAAAAETAAAEAAQAAAEAAAAEVAAAAEACGARVSMSMEPGRAISANITRILLYR